MSEDFTDPKWTRMTTSSPPTHPSPPKNLYRKEVEEDHGEPYDTFIRNGEEMHIEKTRGKWEADRGPKIMDPRWRANKVSEDFYKYKTPEEIQAIQEDLEPENNPMLDMVNSPSHYGQGDIECIDYIRDFLTKEEWIGYLRGSIAKYMHRWRYKGKPEEDLKKAEVYLGWLKEEIAEDE